MINKTTPVQIEKSLHKKFKVHCAKKDKKMKVEIENFIKSQITK